MMPAKSLVALRLGYVLFWVNQRWFLTYSAASAYLDRIKGNVEYASFIGLHLRRGPESFYTGWNVQDLSLVPNDGTNYYFARANGLTQNPK